MALAHSYSAIDMYKKCPKQYYHLRIAKTHKSQPNEYSVYGERAHKSLENRLLKDQPLPEHLKPQDKLITMIQNRAVGHTLYGEQQLALTVDLHPTEWFAKDVWMRAILDVAVIGQKNAWVGDWKTGKVKDSPLQLMLFALFVFEHHPTVESVNTTFLWLKSDSVTSATYQRGEKAALWSEVCEEIEQIEASVKHDNWPAKPSGLCRYCAVKNTCEFARS